MRWSTAALAARVSVGGWFEAYDLFMASYIALGLYREGLFVPAGGGPAAFGAFVAAGFAGMFAGTIAFGWISDAFGRRATFTWSLIVYSAMTLGMALGRSAAEIDAWRFFAGIGIGVQIVTIDAYVTEIAPAATRGAHIALVQALSFTAVPVVALLAAWLVPLEVGGHPGWRVVAALGSLGAVAAWFAQRDLPESSAWQHRAPGAVWTDLFGPRYAARTRLLVVFNLLQPFGYYGFTSWVTTLLYQEGVTLVHSLRYSATIAFAFPLGSVLAIAVADRIERKWQIAGLAAFIAAAGLTFAASRAPAAIIFAGFALSLALNWFSSAFHAYQAELYPTRVRARAVGFVYSWSRLSSIGVGLVVGAVLARFGAPAAFAMIAGPMAAIALLIALLGPKTNRLELETLAP